jgi:hypothetical protein
MSKFDALMNVTVSRHMAIVLAKVAPWAGGFVVVASVEAGQTGGGEWTEVWRVGMSAALGIFVALVGAIYQNVNRRLTDIEEGSKKAKDEFVTLREYNGRHGDLKEQLDRIESNVGRKR